MALVLLTFHCIMRIMSLSEHNAIVDERQPLANLEHPMSSHSGRTAIVTGASSGIGRASAEALARGGFIVFGTSRRAASNGPDGVTMLACDVTDDASVNALVS